MKKQVDILLFFFFFFINIKNKVDSCNLYMYISLGIVWYVFSNHFYGAVMEARLDASDLEGQSKRMRELQKESESIQQTNSLFMSGKVDFLISSQLILSYPKIYGRLNSWSHSIFSSSFWSNRVEWQTDSTRKWAWRHRCRSGGSAGCWSRYINYIIYWFTDGLTMFYFFPENDVRRLFQVTISCNYIFVFQM